MNRRSFLRSCLGPVGLVALVPLVKLVKSEAAQSSTQLVEIQLWFQGEIKDKFITEQAPGYIVPAEWEKYDTGNQQDNFRMKNVPHLGEDAWYEYGEPSERARRVAIWNEWHTSYLERG